MIKFLGLALATFPLLGGIPSAATIGQTLLINQTEDSAIVKVLANGVAPTLLKTNTAIVGIMSLAPMAHCLLPPTKSARGTGILCIG